MKFISTIAALSLLAAPAYASSEAHAKCSQVADYAGCMQFQTGAVSTNNDELNQLRIALKTVRARLSAGTSLRDSSSIFMPVTDALALVPASKQNSVAYVDGKKAADLFNIMQSAWQIRIKAKIYSWERYGKNVYVCSALKASADAFDAVSGRPPMNWNYRKGLFGGNSCQVSDNQLPEVYMRRVIDSYMASAAVDPAVIAQREADQKEQERLASMEDWERYLEENPNLKAWAKANPKLAEAKRKEWAAKNSQN